MTVAIVNAKTGAVKMLHPEVADVAQGTGAVPERRARSAAQLEEEAEAARQRAGGAPASEWARKQTAEIKRILKSELCVLGGKCPPSDLFLVWSGFLV